MQDLTVQSTYSAGKTSAWTLLRELSALPRPLASGEGLLPPTSITLLPAVAVALPVAFLCSIVSRDATIMPDTVP